MRCRCLSAWSRTIQHVARQLYVCLHSHLFKLVIVLAVLIALQYLITAIFEARQFEPLFTLNSTHYRIHSQRHWIHNSRGLLFPSHNSSFNGSMHVSMDRAVSPIENVTGETRTSSFILTPNAVGSASSFVFSISVSSLNPTTTPPSLTVPFTGKSLCPPIPPNLSKYYETLHFIFFYFAGCWCILRPVMRLFECILLPLPKVSATYIIFFSLEGDFRDLYVARGGFAFNIFKAKNKPLQTDIATSQQNIIFRKNKSYMFGETG